MAGSASSAATACSPAHRADESLVLARRRDPRAPLPRARPGRPLRLPRGEGPRGRARPPDRSDLRGGHRRRQPRCDLRAGPPRPRLRGPHRPSVLLPRDRGVRPERPGRARGRVERPPGRTPVEHPDADPLSARRRTPDHRRGRAARARSRANLRGRRGARARPCRLGRSTRGAAASVGAPTWCSTWPPGRTSTAPRTTRREPPRSTSVARRSRRAGAPLVAYSSGLRVRRAQGRGYVESDAPSPLSAYGRSKLHGEAAAGEAPIVRSSWLFGETATTSCGTMPGSVPSATRSP